jgi:hypothetical protein
VSIRFGSIAQDLLDPVFPQISISAQNLYREIGRDHAALGAVELSDGRKEIDEFGHLLYSNSTRVTWHSERPATVMVSS